MLKVSQECDCDVLVAGAGPAGAVTATYLARQGFRVMLLDQHQFPRDKVCGDFVGPVGLYELSLLDIDEAMLQDQTNIINYASAFLNNEVLVSATIPHISDLVTHGRVIPRLLLDNWIFQKAIDVGVDVRENYRVIGIENSKHHVTITARHGENTYYFRSRLLVGADGSNSVVARNMRGYSPPPNDRIFAVRAYFEGVEGPQDRADLYFTSNSFPGYCWLFPTGEGKANVGVGMASGMIPDTKPDLKGLLLKLIASDRILKQRLENAQLTSQIRGWPLTTYDHRLPICDARIILVGDAAGLINPLNGEGIQYALLSGRWAAESVAPLLETDDLTGASLSIFAKRVEKELRYDMAVATLIVQCVRNRNFNPIWLQTLKIIGEAASNDSRYASIAGGVLAGLLPANELLGYQVLGGTIKQAIMTLGLGGINNALSQPMDTIHSGFNVARSGVDIFFSTLHNFRETGSWGWDVATGLTELAVNYYQDQADRYL